MSSFHVVILALVQGITEFLPISSSGHLVLVPHVLGVVDQGLAIDVAAHMGTLIAVILYFNRDILHMLRGGLRLLLRLDFGDPGARMGLMIVFATIPVIIAGLSVHHFAGETLRNPTVIATTTLVFGVLLWAADRWGAHDHDFEEMTWRHALLIGASQILALIPGTSRSGITMTVARALGHKRDAAARFSMLLSIPTIAGAGTLAAMDLAASGNSELTTDALMTAGLSFVSALGAIHFLMRWLQHFGFMPFVIYRLILGVVLFAFF